MRIHLMRAVISHHERLRKALGFVIDRSRPDRVYVAPVALRLRMLSKRPEFPYSEVGA